jgi:hypothetical protein
MADILEALREEENHLSKIAEREDLNISESDALYEVIRRLRKLRLDMRDEHYI